jgi:hypothetical protein
VKRFYLLDSREQAEHAVAEGVELATGQVVVSWFGENPSLVIWPTWEIFKTVSVKGHDHKGRMTRRIEWLDE